MYPSLITRFLFYTLIITGTLALFYVIRPNSKLDPQGVILPIAPPLAATDASTIQLLSYPPTKYKVLGQVNVERHFLPKKENEDLAKLNAEDYAKTLAAKIGASAIIISAMGTASFPDAGKESTFYVFRGIAIKDAT